MPSSPHPVVSLLFMVLALDVPQGAQVPDAASQAASLKAIRRLHRVEYARARLPAEKSALARRLLAEGKQTSNDPSGSYVLFREARELAVEAMDPTTVLEAIDETAKRFLGVDAMRLKIEALERLGRLALASDASAELAKACFDVTSDALAADSYKEAKSLATLALASSGRSRRKNLTSWSSYLIRLVGDYQREFESARNALAALSRDPQDATASTAAGKFRCLVKGKWDEGSRSSGPGVIASS